MKHLRVAPGLGFWAIAAIVLFGCAALAAQSPLIGARSCVAHAGANAQAPPDTMAAYRLAVEAGADFSEPDLQLTKDGVLVCVHDLSLERSTNVEEIGLDGLFVHSPCLCP